MAGDPKQVRPGVVVEVSERRTPADVSGLDGQARGLGRIRELPAAFVQVEDWRVLSKMSLEDVYPSVAVRVSNRDPHAGLFPAIFVHRNSTFQALLSESAIAEVAKVEAGRGVGGDK